MTDSAPTRVSESFFPGCLRGDVKARTIGIVGGIGPEATVDYYRMVLAAFKRLGIDDYRSILINSIDLDKALRYLYADDRAGLIEFMVEPVEMLARGGAEVGLFAANTAHIVFDEIQARSPIPLVSIVAATCDKAKELGFSRVGLLGTRFTMLGTFFPDHFTRHGIGIVVPDQADIDYVHDKYLGELVPGVFLDETREGIVAVMNRLREKHEIDGVILAGTELPLLLRGVSYDLPLLDTATIHIDAIVDAAVIDLN
jgi:aspartate racemase